MALNDYSCRFAARLFEEFPNFRALLVERPDDECFTIRMESPSGVPLWISTEVGDRLTVGFETIHVHFGGWRESVDEVDFDEAIRYILGIIMGDYVVVIIDYEGWAAPRIIRREDLQQYTERAGCPFQVKSWNHG